MAVATLSTRRAYHSAPEVRPPEAAAPLSLTLLEGARECLELDFEACENFMTSSAEDVAQLREVLSV